MGRRTVDGSRALFSSGSSVLGGTHESLVRFELSAQLLFGQRAVLDLGTLVRGRTDGSRVEAKLDLLATLVVGDVGGGDAFHTEDFDFVAISAWERVFDAGKVFRLQLVHLLDMNR